SRNSLPFYRPPRSLNQDFRIPCSRHELLKQVPFFNPLLWCRGIVSFACDARILLTNKYRYLQSPGGDVDWRAELCRGSKIAKLSRIHEGLSRFVFVAKGEERRQRCVR